MELLIKVKKDKTKLVLKAEDKERKAVISSSRLLRDLFLKLDELFSDSQKSSLERVKVEGTDDCSQMSLRIARAFREGSLISP
jgi:hypothetical protein